MLAAVSLLAGAAAGSIPAAATPAGAELRAGLVRLLAAQRGAARLPALRPSAALERAAQERAGAAAARGSLGAAGGSDEALRRQLSAAGYEVRQWVESVAELPLPASAEEALDAWRGDASGTWRRLLDPGFEDLGIGVAADEARGEVYLVILIAGSQGEDFARDTSQLRDLERVRAEVLAQVNLRRRRAGEPPLARSHALEAAAQRHAEDMLARSYFAHQSPQGTTVRTRAQAAGYEWRSVGENLAEGQRTVDEVVEAWMRSAPHRANILDRDFIDTGIGLALGRDPRTGERRILWVQTFGLPR